MRRTDLSLSPQLRELGQELLEALPLRTATQVARAECRQRGLALANRIQEPRRIERGEVQGRIDFNRIRFAYEEGRPVIHELDLHVRPGEMIGVVGATGAGKSSLIGLATR